MLRLGARAAARPLGRRCMSVEAVKATNAELAKYADVLPESVKPLVAEGLEAEASVSKFAADNPEMYKLVVDKIAASDAAAGSASVSDEDGGLAKDMGRIAAIIDRRSEALKGVEYKLTAAEKAEWEAMYVKAAEAKGLKIGEDVDAPKAPDTMVLDL
jgi:hypothetical protein